MAVTEEEEEPTVSFVLPVSLAQVVLDMVYDGQFEEWVNKHYGTAVGQAYTQLIEQYTRQGFQYAPYAWRLSEDHKPSWMLETKGE